MFTKWWIGVPVAIVLAILGLAIVTGQPVYREPGVSEMPTDTANMTMSWNARSTKAGNWTTARNNAQRSDTFAFTQGTGAGQVNLIAHGVWRPEQMTPVNYDLQDFTDLFGQTGSAFGVLRVAWFKNIGTTDIQFTTATYLAWLGTAVSEAELFRPDDVHSFVSWNYGWGGLAACNQFVIDSQGYVEDGALEYFLAGAVK